MPEITSVEAIRGKLAEFDRQMEDVLVTVRTLVQVKADAQASLAEIQTTSRKSQEAQLAADELRAKVNGILGEWMRLRGEVTQAGQRFAEENRIALAAQADLLRGLEASTQANAETAEAASASVVAAADRVEALLATVRGELESEVRARLSQAEELIESETRRVEKYLEQEQAGLTVSTTRQREELQRRIEEEIGNFTAEMREQLSEHQRRMDRQLTEFLHKQNVLVQNLTQQIDGYDRAARAQAARHEELATTVSGLGTRIEEARGELTALAARFDSLESSAGDTAVRLGETLKRLCDIPIVGRRFT
ncbi:MAG: hypothetical protein HS113_08435 [Verrucomicrobiales bacterium]|nr:hypothetical protein [Verrucomicrobiales bacterium]